MARKNRKNKSKQSSNASSSSKVTAAESKEQKLSAKVAFSKKAEETEEIEENVDIAEMKSPQNNLRDEKDEKSSKSQKVEEEKKSQDDEVLEITTNSESKTEREMKLYKEEEEESGEPLYVESNDFQESDPISPDTEEGYVQVTHQDSYPEDISKIRNDDMEEETPPQEPTQDDDAILEGILSGSDELSAKYRMHSESYSYPNAPPSTPDEGPIPLSHFDHVTLRSSFEENEEEEHYEFSPRSPIPQVPPPLPPPPPDTHSTMDIPADDMEESNPPVSFPPPEVPQPPAAKANPVPLTRSSSNPLSTAESAPASQRRPSFKDTAEYTFMETLSNPQPPPIVEQTNASSPGVSSSPPRHSSSPPASTFTPPSSVEKRVLIALTLRVLYELRARRILDQSAVGLVKEELFGSMSNSASLTYGAEKFLMNQDLDPLLAQIFQIVGLDGVM